MLRLVCLFAVLIACPAVAQRPALDVTIAGAMAEVFRHDRDGCDRHDKPDAPARAIRLADGTVALFAPHFDNRALRGPDLLSVRPDCTITFQGAEDPDPARFSDRSWITALWTEDGAQIFAVIHNEYQGHRHTGRCPTRRYHDCWYNALTAAVSVDGARSFRPLGPPPHLIAALPDTAEAVQGAPGGFFNPTGVVRHGDALYMMAYASGRGTQPRGTCLMRTRTIEDPASWRGFSGRDFTVRFVDPYAGTADPSAHVCAPIGRSRLQWPVTALVRHRPTGLFIAVMQGRPHRPDREEPVPGIYVATSPDLLEWSAPAFVMPAIDHGRFRCGGPQPLVYPSLLDPESPSPSFDIVGDTAQLYLTRFDVPDCRIHGSRSLVRIPVSITRAVGSPRDHRQWP
jgi:hypothetical protein